MLKKILFLTLTVLTSTVMFAQGIEFETSSWSDMLKKAQKENKLIYIDAYASWCGPCKMMKKNIFPDAQVGTFFNTNFVNAQIDMEKGEGPGLAKTYGVNAYPTHLFVNGKGELVHLGLGYMDAVQFVSLGKQAVDPKQQYITMQKMYDEGNRDIKLLADYMELLYQTGDPKGDLVAQEYFKTQDDLTSDENIKWLNAFAVNPASVNHPTLLANKAALTQKLKSEFLGNFAYNYYVSGLKQNKDLDAAQKHIREVYPEESDILTFYLATYYHKKNKDTEKYDQALTSFLTPENLSRFDQQELNSYAWYVYENSEDKARIKQAISWAEASVAKQPQYANTDTLAWLYYKSGDVTKAKEIAAKAIALGKATGNDTSSTEELLTK